MLRTPAKAAFRFELPGRRVRPLSRSVAYPLTAGELRDPSELPYGQIRNQQKVPWVACGNSVVKFEGSDSDQQVRQCDARPCRLRLSVDLSSA